MFLWLQIILADSIQEHIQIMFFKSSFMLAPKMNMYKF